MRASDCNYNALDNGWIFFLQIQAIFMKAIILQINTVVATEYALITVEASLFMGD